MMFNPRWPSAGPIGGEGFAFPAGTCSLIKPTTFFAMILCSCLRVHARLAVSPRLLRKKRGDHLYAYFLDCCLLTSVFCPLTTPFPPARTRVRPAWPGQR